MAHSAAFCDELTEPVPSKKKANSYLMFNCGVSLVPDQINRNGMATELCSRIVRLSPDTKCFLTYNYTQSRQHYLTKFGFVLPAKSFPYLPVARTPL
jgi:hypothetical protein